MTTEDNTGVYYSLMMERRYWNT